MASDGRKSLMIGKEAHAHLMQLAETFKVSQPEMVEALIKSVDKMRLQATLTEMASRRQAEADEAQRKKALVERMLKEMDAKTLEKLLLQGAAS